MLLFGSIMRFASFFLSGFMILTLDARVNAGNPFQGDWDNVQARLSSANDALNDVSAKLAAAEAKVRDAQRVADDCKAVQTSLQDAVNSAAKAIASASEAKSAVLKDIVSATNAISVLEKQVKTAAEKIEQLEFKLLNQKILVYSINTPLSIDFNPAMGGIHSQASLGFGLRFGSHELQELLGGRFSMPDIDAIEGLTSAVGLKHSISGNYAGFSASVVHREEGKSVYVSSQRFVDWAGPERVADGGVKILSTGGAGARDVAREVLYMLELEFDDIVSWLSSQGTEQPEDLAVKIIEAVASHGVGVIPGIQLKMVPVEYVHLFEMRGVTELPQPILDRLKLQKVLKGQSQVVNHFGFILELAESLAGDHGARAANMLSGHVPPNLQGINFPQLVAKKGGPQLKKLLQLTAATEIATEPAELELIHAMQSVFKCDKDLQEQVRKSPNSMIDLTESAIGVRLRTLLSSIAIGNERTVKLESLTLEPLACRFSLRATLVSRHSWGTLAQAVEALKTKVSGVPIGANALLTPTGAAQLAAAETASQSAREALNKGNQELEQLNKQLTDLGSAVVAAETNFSEKTQKLNEATKILNEAAEALTQANKSVADLSVAKRNAENAINDIRREYERIKNLLDHWNLIPKPLPIPNPIKIPRIRIKW